MLLCRLTSRSLSYRQFGIPNESKVRQGRRSQPCLPYIHMCSNSCISKWHLKVIRLLRIIYLRANDEIRKMLIEVLTHICKQWLKQNMCMFHIVIIIIQIHRSMQVGVYKNNTKMIGSHRRWTTG